MDSTREIDLNQASNLAVLAAKQHHAVMSKGFVCLFSYDRKVGADIQHLLRVNKAICFTNSIDNLGSYFD